MDGTTFKASLNPKPAICSPLDSDLINSNTKSLVRITRKVWQS